MKKILILILCFFTVFLFAQEKTIWEINSNCKKHLSTKHISSESIMQTPLLFDYDVKFYFLNINVESDTLLISGDVSIMAKSLIASMDTFAIELIDEMFIDSIILGDEKLNFYRNNHEVFVPLTNKILKDEYFTARIYYGGTPPSEGFFSGVTSSFDDRWNKHVTYTLSEPFNARQWWPCKQVLSDKADSVWVFLSTSEQNKAGSNGVLTHVENLPDNRKRFEWKSNYPIAYYLISFAVAEYQEYNIYAFPEQLGGDSILIQNYIYNTPECLETLSEEIDQTIPLIEFFSNTYGLYPFHEEKYGHCLTSMGGGMEHQTMTTLGNFQIGLVSHELGHMWFGDHVSCASWSDIWINEGFATYTTYLTYEFITPGSFDSLWRENNHKRITAEADGSIYVPPQEILYNNESRIFDNRLSYYKGAYLLHMIRFELQDDELFFQVLRDFQNTYSHSVASGDDFLFVLNTSTGRNFDDFFDQWYYAEGHPVFDIKWYQNDEELVIKSVQKGSCPGSPGVFKMHYPIQLFWDNGQDTSILVYQENSEEIFKITSHLSVDSIQIDPEKHVLKEINSIVHENDNEVMIYPNPATHYLFYTLPFNMLPSHLSLYDQHGTILSEFETDFPSGNFSISDLPEGIYLLNFRSEIKSFTKKMIKVK